MNRIIFEGVRCFFDEHVCPLKPVTLLVGENSSGKTTFLAMTRIASDIAQGELGEDVFNEEPFLLGSYDQIASFKGGKAGRAKSFVIGLEASVREGTRLRGAEIFGDSAVIAARFTAEGAQPTLSEWTFECGKVKVVARPATNQTKLNITIETPRGSQKITTRVPPRWISFPRIVNELRFSLLPQFREPKQAGKARNSIISESELYNLRNIAVQVSHSLFPRPFAFAPIRSRPERTYDPVRDVPRPEGSHMPMVLAKEYLKKSQAGDQLRQSLRVFGEVSGLFKAVEVKRKGSKESDPFQIGVKITGTTFNLVDVGYGVSQVLPILVDVVLNPRRSSFLLQQPEVHLHPKAQAELGSFLASLAKRQNKTFIIETHSDYLIDRIRMDVRDKKSIDRDDVAILYFEKTKRGVAIHHLLLDEFGNITNAPASYRKFFLQEERRLIGI